MRRILVAGLLALALVAVAAAFERPWQSGSGPPPAIFVRQRSSAVGAPARIAVPHEEQHGLGDIAPAFVNVVPTAVQRPGSEGCGSAFIYGDFVETLSVQGEDRSYRLHIPYLYNPLDPAPLVLSFHGSGQSALAQETYSRLDTISDREGFVLVTPEGNGNPRGWDIPGIYHDDGFDDVNFTVLLVAKTKLALCIDPDRVFATGMSNGAEMAALAGCRQPDIFAAVAPVAGVIFDGCESPGLPIIAFHGTADENIPFEYAPEAVAEWARADGCVSGPNREQVTEHVAAVAYADCDGRDVILYVIEGGGHTWPGAEDDAGGAGPTTHEIDANELIWAFFVAHPRLLR